MKVLVLNCGSSSLKYQLINMDDNTVLAMGKYERIGEKEAFIEHKVHGKKIRTDKSAMNHTEAIDFTLNELINPEYKVVDTLEEISAIGHRVVHGGEFFKSSVIITDEVIEKIKECNKFAPLHNPAAILGIEACKEIMSNKPMVAVFDTTFHQSIEKDKYLYPIEYKYYEKDGIRKYGFHGTSHMYVSNRLAEIIGKDIKDLKIISCHIGQGASICAINAGKSVDTSMGLTPLAGLSMITRSGDIDPSVLTYIMKKDNISAQQMEDILNKKSGLSGMSNLVPDFREICKETKNGNEKAQLAFNNFVYSISGYIAKYMVALNGADYIVFTGGIGENQGEVREAVCESLSFAGVKIDDEKNTVKSEEQKISAIDSKVGVLVVPTNEELVIARETVNLIKFDKL